eukprot:3469682-Rhodomonas_salina.1
MPGCIRNSIGVAFVLAMCLTQAIDHRRKTGMEGLEKWVASELKQLQSTKRPVPSRVPSTFAIVVSCSDKIDEVWTQTSAVDEPVSSEPAFSNLDWSWYTQTRQTGRHSE